MIEEFQRLIRDLNTKKDSYRNLRNENKFSMKIASKLGFDSQIRELQIINNNYNECIDLIDEFQQRIQVIQKKFDAPTSL